MPRAPQAARGPPLSPPPTRPNLHDRARDAQVRFERVRVPRDAVQLRSRPGTLRRGDRATLHSRRGRRRLAPLSPIRLPSWPRARPSWPHWIPSPCGFPAITGFWVSESATWPRPAPLPGPVSWRIAAACPSAGALRSVAGIRALPRRPHRLCRERLSAGTGGHAPRAAQRMARSGAAARERSAGLAGSGVRPGSGPGAPLVPLRRPLSDRGPTIAGPRTSAAASTP